jgi:type IV pilus assembly protein PilO
MRTELFRQILMTRRKSFVIIAVLVVLNIGLFAYSSAYLEPQLTGLQQKWSEMRRQAAAGALIDPASVYRQGRTDLENWRARISPKKEFASFIGELFETATNNSLRVGAITYKPGQVKGEELLAYAIGFNVSGKYAAIKSFIADLEKLKEIAVIDNISLNGKSDEESVDMRVQMTAYFRGEKQ